MIHLNSTFIFSDSNKRYHTFDYYLKHKYGRKVFKVALDAGFTCPNRDGTISTGGCIYCSKYGSGEYAGNRSLDLLKQYEEGKAKMLKKWPNSLVIAYFQAFTNTYSSIDYLKKCYEPFIGMKDVVGIAIATRPDCLSKDILDYLETINNRTDLYVELGLQTAFDSTAEIINRGYRYSTFLEAVRQLNMRRINIIVHLINGLPGESKEMMLENVRRISSLPISGIKLHCLNILKDTVLFDMYKNGKTNVMTKEKYLDIVSDQLALIPPAVTIERINTDSKRSDLIAPLWNDKKIAVSNDLDKLMMVKNIYQGDKYNNSTNLVLYSHFLTDLVVSKGLVVDATLGNGHDTLFLINNYKKVISFDIQELAIKRSKKLLDGYANIDIIKDNFINIPKYVNQPIDCLIYNLGFLPGSDHKIKTNPTDVVLSLKNTLPMLSKGGVCIVVSYTQHDDGLEYAAILHFVSNLPHYKFIITKFETEYVIEIKKSPV